MESIHLTEQIENDLHEPSCMNASSFKVIPQGEEMKESDNQCVVERETTQIKGKLEAEEKHEETKKETFGNETAEIDNKEQPGNTDRTVVADPFEYTKRAGFTSEIFKIELLNMPKWFGFGELKKKLFNLGLKPVKLKAQGKNFTFVTFRCEEDRESALQVLNGFKWKGSILKAKKANPAADPLLQKRKENEAEGDGHHQNKRQKTDSMVEDGLSPEDRLRHSVCPLCDVSYEEQLQKKVKDIKGVLKKFGRLIEKECPDLKGWLNEQRDKFDWMCCELLDIKPSPVVSSYRNKCEFTIGQDINGKDNTVGFRYGQYSSGSVRVGEPDQIPIISNKMETVVKRFQEYIRSSGYSSYNPENHSGHWKQLTVRISRLNHLMIIVDFHPQQLPQDKIESEKNHLREYFTTGTGQDLGITSCFFRCSGSSADVVNEHLFGDKHITEQLLDLQFRISPDAFFQVNSYGAEVLYKVVAEWCGCSPNTTVLDICCGTGAIGLAVAKNVERVIGVEMCSDAVEDAKCNAVLNGLSNLTYHCAKAEDVLPQMMKTIRSSEIIAVVDPPRAGLHQNVIRAIRRSPFVNKLVYVACNANAALSNFMDLVRPISKRLKGIPFVPVKALPVDLFPHTKHYELLVLFERKASDNQDDSEDMN
ncbi:hypothetical protein ACJMK2_012802 [Sinanodonta woodiana]|uniref:tRNA (uracil(54)-C(5))-methyltransferase n=1 Tax=Sinanodonta woodiana TaxID=1069815 RepID=A0ABD3V9D3_SINWO